MARCDWTLKGGRGLRGEARNIVRDLEKPKKGGVFGEAQNLKKSCGKII